MEDAEARAVGVREAFGEREEEGVSGGLALPRAAEGEAPPVALSVGVAPPLGEGAPPLAVDAADSVLRSVAGELAVALGKLVVLPSGMAVALPKGGEGEGEGLGRGLAVERGAVAEGGAETLAKPMEGLAKALAERVPPTVAVGGWVAVEGAVARGVAVPPPGEVVAVARAPVGEGSGEALPLPGAALTEAVAPRGSDAEAAGEVEGAPTLAVVEGVEVGEREGVALPRGCEGLASPLPVAPPKPLLLE